MYSTVGYNFPGSIVCLIRLSANNKLTTSTRENNYLPKNQQQQQQQYALLQLMSMQSMCTTERQKQLYHDET